MIHDVFLKHAAASPDALAVVSAEGTLTYAELKRISGSVAAMLRRSGIGPGSVVGVCLDRGSPLIASLLGVLRCGAAYMPIDPSFPAIRIRQMVDDAAPAAMLVNRAHLAMAVGIAGPVISVEDLPEAGAPPPVPVGSSDLAYVIYTSGSTGTPKGAMIEHGGLANVLKSVQHLVNAGPSDRLLAVSTVSFDIAGLEIFLPLTTGGAVVIASRTDSLDGRVLARLLEDERITLFQATPATWRMLVDTKWQGRRGLRGLVGGEALAPDLATILASRMDELWNMYGPTETTIWSTAHRVTGHESPVPIGRALDNTTLHIFDEDMQPASQGELCIGGAGVARGYLNRPELTRKRFITAPTSDARLYRTGDVCRWRTDGALEFLGRLDNQVKVRGHRVELQDVETAMAGQPDLREIVVGARTHAGSTTLVAYATAREGCTPTLAALRHWASERVPTYMLPTELVLVDAMPRTPAGKTDRAALAALSQRTEAPDDTPQAADDLELVLLNVFRDVLGVGHVALDDDFFDIGGHSLLAFRAAQEIERRTGRSVDVSSMFEHSTVKALAPVVRQQGGIALPAMTIDLQRRGEKPPLICLCGVALYLPLARALAPDQPVSAVYVNEELDVFHANGSIRQRLTIEFLASRYVEQIRRRHPKGPYRLAGFSMGGAVAFEVARILQAEGHRVDLVAMVDAYLAGSIRRNMLATVRWGVHRLRSRGLGWALNESLRRLRPGRTTPGDATLSEEESKRLEVEARADAILSTYRPLPCAVDVVYFNAADSPRFPHLRYDESGGWREAVGDRLKVVMVPGTHAQVLAVSGPAMAQVIREHLRPLDENGHDARNPTGNSHR